MTWLREATVVTVRLGMFVDRDDGVTPEGGLTTSMDTAITGLQVSKNGTAMVDRNSVTGSVHDALGDYLVELDAIDTDETGRLRLLFEESATCLPIWRDFMVLPAAKWDAIFGTESMPSDMVKILGTALTEPDLPGQFAKNISQFYRVNPTTGKDVNEVGSTVTTGPKQNFSISSTLTSATEAGTHVDTHERDATDWVITPTATATGGVPIEYATIDFTLDQVAGGIGQSVHVEIGLVAGGMRFVNVEVEDQLSPTNYDFLGSTQNTAGGIITIDANLLSQHTDAGTGLVRLRIWSSDLTLGIDEITLHYMHVVNTSDGGSIPSATEIAISVDQLQSSNHGDGNWEGDVVHETFVSQPDVSFPNRVFTLATGPDQDDVLVGEFVTVHKLAVNEFDSGLCIFYDGAGKIVTLAEDLLFAPAAGDEVSVRLNVASFNATTVQGVVSAFTANTITLDTRDTSVDGTHDRGIITFISGTNNGSSGVIASHLSGVVTAQDDWNTLPTAGDVYSIVPGGSVADVTSINGSIAAAVALALSANTMRVGTVDDASFTSTVTEFESDVTEPLAGHWKPSLVIWTSGSLSGHRANVGAYSLIGGKGHFTVDAMPTAPANNDTFILV